RRVFGLVQPQETLTLWTKLDTVRRRPLRGNSYAERFECLEEERFARRLVADSEFDVVKHEFSYLAECRRSRVISRGLAQRLQEQTKSPLRNCRQMLHQSAL